MKARYLVPVLFVFLFAGCAERTEETEEMDQAAVQHQQAIYQRSQPIPQLAYSLERDIVIQLYTARNERVATHTIWRGDTSVIEGDCSSIGYPIPYDTSLTNPLQVQVLTQYNSGTIEQAEPNGIFASKNSIATWVRCVVDGQEAPIYVEGKVTAYPYPVVVDYETNRAIPAKGAKPTVVIKPKD